MVKNLRVKYKFYDYIQMILKKKIIEWKLFFDRTWKYSMHMVIKTYFTFVTSQG